MLELTSNPRPEQLQPQGVQKLTNSDAAEVLDFLSRRPLNTFIMASFIRENGIASPAHRGEFFAYRNAFGALEGVALIGHLILLETNSDAAMNSTNGSSSPRTGVSQYRIKKAIPTKLRPTTYRRSA